MRLKYRFTYSMLTDLAELTDLWRLANLTIDYMVNLLVGFPDCLLQSPSRDLIPASIHHEYDSSPGHWSR